VKEIELLHFDGCPGYERLLPRLREPAGAAAPPAELHLEHVESLEQAEELRFPGSPSIRVDGADVEPGAGARTDFGLKCRLYRCADGSHGPFPEDWLRAVLDGSQPERG
jgi:hypothetical protein